MALVNHLSEKWKLKEEEKDLYISNRGEICKTIKAICLTPATFYYFYVLGRQTWVLMQAKNSMTKNTKVNFNWQDCQAFKALCSKVIWSSFLTLSLIHTVLSWVIFCSVLSEASNCFCNFGTRYSSLPSGRLTWSDHQWVQWKVLWVPWKALY